MVDTHIYYDYEGKGTILKNNAAWCNFRIDLPRNSHITRPKGKKNLEITPPLCGKIREPKNRNLKNKRLKGYYNITNFNRAIVAIPDRKIFIIYEQNRDTLCELNRVKLKQFVSQTIISFIIIGCVIL